MIRWVIRLVSVALGIFWLTFVGVDLFSVTFGDCVDEACEKYRDAMMGFFFWRGLCVALLIVIAYRAIGTLHDV